MPYVIEHIEEEGEMAMRELLLILLNPFAYYEAMRDQWAMHYHIPARFPKLLIR